MSSDSDSEPYNKFRDPAYIEHERRERYHRFDHELFYVEVEFTPEPIMVFGNHIYGARNLARFLIKEQPLKIRRLFSIHYGGLNCPTRP